MQKFASLAEQAVQVCWYSIWNLIVPYKQQGFFFLKKKTLDFFLFIAKLSIFWPILSFFTTFHLQFLETDCHNFALPLWHLFFRNVPLSHEWIGLSILPTHFKFQSFINFTKIFEFIPKDSWYLYYLPLNCILLLLWKI